MAAAPEEFSRYDRKLEFILSSAARIFADKGFHSTSVRDISRSTKISLAGLYHYFRSKQELLFLIQDDCFGRVLEGLEQHLASSNDPMARIRLFIENHVSFFAANMAEMKVLSHEADSLEGDLGRRVSMKKERYTRLARKLIQDVLTTQTGSKKSTKTDLTVATYGLFGMMNWIYTWYDPRGKVSVPELVSSITQLFLNGLLNGRASGRAMEPSVVRSGRLSVWRG